MVAVDAAPTLPKCKPSGAGPYYLLEGEPVQVQLRCETGADTTQAQLSFESLPAGATYDAATATMSWTPRLDQAAVYELTIRSGSWSETGSVKLGVADKFSDPANVPVLDETKYTEEYGLPVIHLHPDPTLNYGEYTPAKFTYRGHEYMAEAQYRGSFSYNFPRHSYTIKFTKADKFNEPVGAGGFHKKRKIVLVSPFNDNSYLRARIGFELWNKLDPKHILVQSFSAVVFLDGVYHGLYTVVDHVNEYLMEDFGLAQKGNLYRGRLHDANFRLTNDMGIPKTVLHEGLTKEKGTPEDGEPGAFDDLHALIQWVASAPSATFLSEIDTRIMRSDYEDWWMFVSFIMANDSIGKNAYHYHDPMKPDSRWRYIPWDLDESFGQNYRTKRVSATEQKPEGGLYFAWNYLSERLLAEPTLGNPLRARYKATLQGAFALAPIVARIDAMAAEIKLSALRDEQKWGEAYRTFPNWRDREDFNTHEAEVTYLKTWITARHAFIDGLY